MAEKAGCPKWGKIEGALFKFEGDYNQSTLFEGGTVCAQGALWLGMGRNRSGLLDEDDRKEVRSERVADKDISRDYELPGALPADAVRKVSGHYGLDVGVVNKIPEINDDDTNAPNVPMGVFLWLRSEHDAPGAKQAFKFRNMLADTKLDGSEDLFLEEDDGKAKAPFMAKVAEAEEKTKRLAMALRKTRTGRFALKAVKFMVDSTVEAASGELASYWTKAVRQAYFEMLIPDLAPKYAAKASEIAGVCHFLRAGHISEGQSCQFRGKKVK